MGEVVYRHVLVTSCIALYIRCMYIVRTILFLAHLLYFESVVRCTLSIARSGGWPGIAAVTTGVLSGRVGGVDVAWFCVASALSDTCTRVLFRRWILM